MLRKYPARTRNENNLAVVMPKQLCITLFGFWVEEDHGGHLRKFITERFYNFLSSTTKIFKIVL